jgi:hypothetical protein
VLRARQRERTTHPPFGWRIFSPLPQTCFPISYGGKLFKFAYCASMPCEQNGKPIVSRRPSLARTRSLSPSSTSYAPHGSAVTALWKGLPGLIKRGFVQAGSSMELRARSQQLSTGTMPGDKVLPAPKILWSNPTAAIPASSNGLGLTHSVIGRISGLCCQRALAHETRYQAASCTHR